MKRGGGVKDPRLPLLPSRPLRTSSQLMALCHRRRTMEQERKAVSFYEERARERPASTLGLPGLPQLLREESAPPIAWYLLGTIPPCLTDPMHSHRSRFPCYKVKFNYFLSKFIYRSLEKIRIGASAQLDHRSPHIGHKITYRAQRTATRAVAAQSAQMEVGRYT